MFEKGFECEGAAADEPRVDLENPIIIKKKKTVKGWETNKKAERD